MPVFNMLTAGHHPCQALADLMTLREAFGRLEGLQLAYVGDGNNVARSLAILGALAGVEVVVASPAGYQLDRRAGARLTDDPAEAVAGAHARLRRRLGEHGRRGHAPTRAAPRSAPYRLDDALLDRAAPGRDRAALPAGAPGRGDHRRGALRPAPAHLGSGREPPPRAEGAAGVLR